MFIHCQDLIVKIKSNEIIVSSTDPKSTDEVQEIVQAEEDTRKNIRESRLKKYQEYADMDQQFQRRSLEGLDDCKKFFEESGAFKKEMLTCLNRMVVCMEQSNAYYCL